MEMVVNQQILQTSKQYGVVYENENQQVSEVKISKRKEKHFEPKKVQYVCANFAKCAQKIHSDCINRKKEIYGT